ncbi:hypothetical protein BC829DRAFT_415231 [Chytridium lagenaria]|nr:hypothetical protein BC829DRAFT_415231 [Chytridium lagenaria]
MVSIEEVPDAPPAVHQRKGKKKGATAQKEEKKPLLEISEEEQMRIIEETGILHKIKKDPRYNPSAKAPKPKPTQNDDSDAVLDDGEDDDTDVSYTASEAEDDDEANSDPNAEPPVIPTAILLTVPLIILHQILDYAVHQQYSSLDEFTLSRMLIRVPALSIALFLIICLTSGPRRKLIITQLVLAIASAVSGMMIVKYSEGMETFGRMLRTPGLAILWIYSVIQLRLDVAVGSLLVPLVFFFRESIFKSQLTNIGG